MDEKQAPTTVTIYGVEYRLRGPEDPEFIRRVAAVAEERMREIATRQHTASQTRVAVMALLNVTGELLREQEARRDQEAELRRRVSDLSERVEAVLPAKR
jgi:cell division protein ZapA (FtsZ GTPase activity inhibitor)